MAAEVPVWWLAVGEARADDAAAVAPWRDGAVVVHVWNERVELAVAGPEGVRRSEVLADEVEVTNPAIACAPRGCLVAWVSRAPGREGAWVAPFDPDRPRPPGERVSLGAATRVHLRAEGSGFRAVVEDVADERRGTRRLSTRALDRRGAPRGPAAPVTEAPVGPYTTVLEEDGGLRWVTEADRAPEGWRLPPGATVAVPAEPALRHAEGLCGDGRRLPPGGSVREVCGDASDAFGFTGPGGTQVWVDHDARALVGAVDATGAVAWKVTLAELGDARASWVVRCGLFPLFEAGHDGLRPFAVPVSIDEALAGTLTFTFGGPVAGTVTATAPPAEVFAAAFAAGADFPDREALAPGQVWYLARGERGREGRAASVEASLPVDGLTVPAALSCGAPRSVAWEGGTSVVLVFERHATTFRFDARGLDPDADTWDVSGAWIGNGCGLEGPGTLVIARARGEVIWSREREVAHRGLVPF